jgi:hypothetical protein
LPTLIITKYVTVGRGQMGVKPRGKK